MKLQRFIQEVASVLETTSSQVVRDMPRVIKSVDVVQQEVAALKVGPKASLQPYVRPANDKNDRICFFFF